MCDQERVLFGKYHAKHRIHFPIFFNFHLLQVEFWFDASEGKPDALLVAKWAAEKAAR